MPLGNIKMGPALIQSYIQTQPKKVLELGIGFGYWGATLRNYCSGDPAEGGMDMSKFILDGVEIFPSYRNPLWACYNNVIIGDISEHLQRLEEYDLIVLIDVAEHLSKDITRHICEQSTAIVLGVCTDMQENNPRNPYGNKYENHITYWTQDDFLAMGLKTETLDDDYFIAWKP